MAVVSVENGIEDVVRVERIHTEEDARPIAITNDVCSWLADTGEPLTRSRRGLKIRPIGTHEARDKIRGIIDAIDLDSAEGRNRIMTALSRLL